MKLLRRERQVEGNRLFFVCPFSQMELFLSGHYGEKVYFATSIAALPQFGDRAYVNSIIELIINENIYEMAIAIDTDCRFLSDVLNKKCSEHSKPSFQLQKILDLHLAEVVRQKTLMDRKSLFAKLVIHHQVEQMCKVNLFKLLVDSRQVVVKGIITTKAANELVEFSMNTFSAHNGISIIDFKLN